MNITSSTKWEFSDEDEIPVLTIENAGPEIIVNGSSINKTLLPNIIEILQSMVVDKPKTIGKKK